MSNDDQPEFCQAYAALRNEGLSPLTTIQGYANLLQRGLLGALTEQQQQAIDTILSNTKRAMEVWRRGSDYLDAHYVRRPFEPVVLSAVLAEVRQQLASAVSALVTHLPDQLPNILGCEHQLVTALCYLLYPPDYLHYCTQLAPQLTITHDTPSLIDVQIRSALQITFGDVQTERWLWYPGSCLQIAALIVQRHGSTLTTYQTNGEILFTFQLPIIAS